MVIGEITAGIVAGPTALGLVNPLNPTVAFSGQVGFAMLMLSVGMHLPLRDSRLAASLRAGALLAAIVALLAPFAGMLAAAITGSSDAAIYAVVLASCPAAVLLGSLEEAGASGPEALAVMAQVTIADVVTILAVPIVLEPSRAGHAVLGMVLVVAAVAVMLDVSRALGGHAWVDGVGKLSKRRHWALDLRLSLLVLFLVVWLAKDRGLRRGVVVAVIGGPKRSRHRCAASPEAQASTAVSVPALRGDARRACSLGAGWPPCAASARPEPRRAAQGRP